MQQRLRELLKPHNRVGSVQKLMDALTKLQALERKALASWPSVGGVA